MFASGENAAAPDSPTAPVGLWMETFQRIALALVAALTTEQVAEVIITEGLSALGATAGSVALLSEDGTEFVTVRCEGYSPAVAAAFARYPWQTSLPNADAARSGLPVFLGTGEERARRYPHLAQSAAPGRRGAQVALPLLANGRTLGGLAFSFPEDRLFPDSERAFLQTVGHLCAQALERARLVDSARREIGERQQAETALRQSEERYRSLIDATSQIVWTNTPQGEMRGEQPGWGALTGQSRAAYEGYGWADAVHPDDAQPTVDAWNQSVASRSPFVFEHRVRRHDGVYRTFAIRAMPLFDTGEAIREWVGVHTDITERQEAAQAIQDSETRKRAILEAALDCIITMDTDQRILEWNPAAERTFGFTSAQALGQTMSQLIVPPALREAHARGLAHYLTTGEGPILRQRIEVPALRADGTEFFVELAVVPIVLEGRTLFTAYLRDLTERKAAEDERRSAAVRQRTFLRDVLAGVTEGHLILCHTPEELPALLSPYGKPIALSKAGGLRELRHQTRDASQAIGLSSEQMHDIVTAAGESSMNAVVHAGRGEGQVFISEDAGTIQVRITDFGTGIALENLPHATLKKGYSSAGTLGHGMKMMLQTADRVFLLTTATGTTIVLEQDRTGARESVPA